MKWADKLPSLKGIARFFYVATHWGTISHDLEAYRRQIKDREEWADRMLKEKDELHKLQQEKIEQDLARWQILAEHGVTLAERANAEREHTTSILKRIFGDLFDTARLLGIVLSWEAPTFQGLILATLQPAARKLVEDTMAKITPRPSGFARLRDLVNVIDTPLAEALRLGPPPPPVPKQSP